MKRQIKSMVRWIQISNIGTKTAAVILSVVAALVLPQIAHLAGPGMGEMLLPMQLPILFLGFCMGPVAGLVAGFVTPMVSYAITGMPVMAMLPFITLELMAYGFFAGMMKDSKMSNFVKVACVQLAGRMVRSSAVVFVVYVIGSQTMVPAMAYSYVLTGVWGIAVQLLVLPVLLSFVAYKRIQRGR